MTATDAPIRWIRARPRIAASLIALLALLAGPSLRPPVVPVDSTPHASSTARPSPRPEQALLRHSATARSHAAGTSPTPTAALSSHLALPASQPPVGRVGDGRPGPFGTTPSQRPASRGPPR